MRARFDELGKVPLVIEWLKSTVIFDMQFGGSSLSISDKMPSFPMAFEEARLIATIMASADMVLN